MKKTVQLLTYTPDPDKVVAAAAKLCYSQVDVGEIKENLSKEIVENFLDMLSKIGHESPIEHVSFTFGISGVSRSLLAQLTRHRIASYSVKSQRYVSERQFLYVIPPEIEEDEEARRIFISAMEENQKVYDRLSAILQKKHIKKLIAGGISEGEAIKKAEKMAIEDARFVLPNACETNIVVTMNARSLMNFFRHRCCMRAQWEIRALAQEMLLEVLKVAPGLFKKAGPPCVKGICPEGKMSCGEIEKMREKYARLREGECFWES